MLEGVSCLYWIRRSLIQPEGGIMSYASCIILTFNNGNHITLSPRVIETPWSLSHHLGKLHISYLMILWSLKNNKLFLYLSGTGVQVTVILANTFLLKKYHNPCKI